MNKTTQKNTPLLLLLVLVTTVLSFAFGMSLGTRIQAAKTQPKTTCDTVQIIDTTDQAMKSNIAKPTETVIKNYADLQNTSNELDAINLDDLDAALEQNDLDSIGF